jgi:hypothetical protein
MEFDYGREVRFRLRGDVLVVRRERRRWHLRWRGECADAEHIDRAVALLLGEGESTVLPLVAQLLRARPGATLDEP